MSASRLVAAARLAMAATFGLVAVTVGPAAASTGLAINLGHGWVHDSSAPLFDVSPIAPGWTEAGDLLARNDSGAAARLTLAANDIIEAENGCSRAEAVVDQTCKSGQGELGHELTFSVYVDPQNDGVFESAPRWTGTLYDLRSPAVLAASLPAHAIWGIRLVSLLPHDVGNEVQSDQVSFGLRFGLDGPGLTSSVRVKGTKFTRPDKSPIQRVIDALPFTGSPTGRLITGALWLFAAGVAVLALALVRRRERAYE